MARRIADGAVDLGQSLDDLTFEGGFLSFVLGRVAQDFLLAPVIESAEAIDAGDVAGLGLAAAGAIFKPLRAADKVVDAGQALVKKADDFVPAAGTVPKGAKPPNLSPQGASRNGAFREAKRQSGVPVSQQPSRVTPNVDRRGNTQPGKIYEFDVPASGGGTKTVRIRDDAGGHDFGAGNSQNRGSRFNDEAGNHFDY